MHLTGKCEIDILKEKYEFMTNQFSTEALLKVYEEMLLLRRFEEKAGQLYGMGMIGGFCICILDKKLLQWELNMLLIKKMLLLQAIEITDQFLQRFLPRISNG